MYLVYFVPKFAISGKSGIHVLKSQGKISLFYVQSTLVILKSKGPSGTLQNIRTWTYKICRIEENTDGATKFHK